MSEAGVIDGTLGGPVERLFEPLNLDAEVSLIAALLATSNIAGEASGELVKAAVDIFDVSILPLVRDAISQEAVNVAGFPLVDAAELASCLGAEPLAEVLSWAIGVLAGAGEAKAPEALEVYADCLGWIEEPGRLPLSLAASTVVVSFIASANKALAASVEG